MNVYAKYWLNYIHSQTNHNVLYDLVLADAAAVLVVDLGIWLEPAKTSIQCKKIKMRWWNGERVWWIMKSKRVFVAVTYICDAPLKYIVFDVNVMILDIRIWNEWLHRLHTVQFHFHFPLQFGIILLSLAFLCRQSKKTKNQKPKTNINFIDDHSGCCRFPKRKDTNWLLIFFMFCKHIVHTHTSRNRQKNQFHLRSQNLCDGIKSVQQQQSQQNHARNVITNLCSLNIYVNSKSIKKICRCDDEFVPTLIKIGSVQRKWLHLSARFFFFFLSHSRRVDREKTVAVHHTHCSCPATICRFLLAPVIWHFGRDRHFFFFFSFSKNVALLRSHIYFIFTIRGNIDFVYRVKNRTK